MSKNIHVSKMDKLNKEIVYSIIHNTETCIFKKDIQYIRKNSESICDCAQCLFYASILHGQKLAALKEDLKFESLKKIITTPLILQALVNGSINTITILFISLTLSFTFAFGKMLMIKEARYPNEPSSGIYVGITKQHIERVVLYQPQISAPSNLRIAP